MGVVCLNCMEIPSGISTIFIPAAAAVGLFSVNALLLRQWTRLMRGDLTSMHHTVALGRLLCRKTSASNNRSDSSGKSRNCRTYEEARGRLSSCKVKGDLSKCTRERYLRLFASLLRDYESQLG